jgi:hypothetical protein
MILPAYSSSGYYAGSTISGSSLYYATAANQVDGSNLYTLNTNAGSIYSFIAAGFETSRRQQSGNVGYQPPAANGSGALATMSGTWRCVTTYVRAGFSSYYNCCGINITESRYFPGIWVRVS